MRPRLDPQNMHAPVVAWIRSRVPPQGHRSTTSPGASAMVLDNSRLTPAPRGLRWRVIGTSGATPSTPRTERRRGSRDARHWLVLVSAPLLAVSAVINVYSASAGLWVWALRPMAVLVTVAMIVTAVALYMTRRPTLAAALASAVIATLVGGSLFTLALAVTIFVGVAAFAAQRGLPISVHLDEVLTYAPVALVVTGSGWLILSGAVSLEDFQGPTPAETADAGKPSIYVLLLDGYPRDDTLRGSFSYDNTPFIDDMAAVGFEVYRESRTETTHTELTLLNMLATPPAPPPQIGQRTARRAIARSPIVNELRAAGYRMVSINSPVIHTNMSNWDLIVEGGQLTELEIALIQSSPLRSVLGPWVMQQQRDRVYFELAALQELAGVRQQFVLAHIMAPHPPFLFGEPAAADEPLSCWVQQTCLMFSVRVDQLDMSFAEYRERFVGQVMAINELIEGTVREIVRRDPDATIIILSDHGSRYESDTSPEAHRTLFLARTPALSNAFRQTPGPRYLLWRLLHQSDRAVFRP